MKKIKLLCVLGTRPEIIKIAPVIHAAAARPIEIECAIFHTGQHYDAVLDQVFFDELSLPRPLFHCAAGGKPYGAQLNHMVQEIEKAVKLFQPTVVLSEGDTTTACAAALAACKTHTPFAHQEAGLRSGNLAMLEEKHRIVADALATHWYVPTTSSAQNLYNEGVIGTPVVCGNSIVDAVRTYAPRATTVIFNALHINKNEYFLLTAHRRETIAEYASLKKFVTALEVASEKFPTYPIIYPLHPHTKAMLEEYKLTLPPALRVIDPVGFFDMLALEQHATLIMTDSGGIQEEATILRRPCITLRNETERPETLVGDMNVLVGLDAQALVRAIQTILDQKPIMWSNPFGDGTAGRQIVEDLIAHYAHTDDM